MRSSIGRITLRGAKRLAGASGPVRLPPPLSTRSSFAARDFCSTSAVSTEAKHKTENGQAKEAERIAAPGTLPAEAETTMEVMTEDTSMSSVEPGMTAEISQETEAANDTSIKAGSTERKDPAQFLAQLKELVGRNAARSALWHFGSAMKVEGHPSIDANVLKFMLPVLARNSWSQTAAECVSLAIDRRYNLGIGSFNCGLHAMAKSGDAEAVTRALDALWDMKSDSHPNTNSYNYLIASHMYGGKVDEAFDVLTDMKKHLIYPTFATYHALITGCLRRRDPRRAYQTLLAVERQRFDISAMTVAQVLVACANNDDYDHVLHLLAKFEDSLTRYGAELHRIAEFRGLYRLNTEARTTKEDRDALRGDPRLELGAISAVLHSAFRGGRIDIASCAWAILNEQYPDLEIPLPLWYCLIGAYAGAGEFSQALDIVGVMREKGLKPSMRDLDLALVRPLAFDVAAIDEQYYRLCDRAEGKEEGTAASPLASAADSNSDMSMDVADDSPSDSVATNEDPAVKNLSGAEVEDSTGDKKTSSLADAVLNRNNSGSASQTELIFRPKTVGIEELNCIIGACSISQDLDRAFQTYDEVESRFGLERNIETYNSLLEGCVETRRLSGGLRILEEIENVGLKISGHTCHLAVRLLLRGGRSDDVVQLLQKTNEKGNTVPLQTYQMVLKQLMRIEGLELAVQTLKMGEADGYDFRALTGRFDLTSVKNLRNAAYGEDISSPDLGAVDGDGADISPDMEKDLPEAVEVEVNGENEASK